MIESIAGCLKQGGRNLLRGSKKGQCRNRRHLHSTFWSHGAGTINLPAWWILLLQSPACNDDHTWKMSRPSTACAVVSGLQNIFLDFLYPAQTHALIKRLKRSTSAHHQATQSVQQCSRSYTSIATGLISGTVDGSDWSPEAVEDDIATGIRMKSVRTRRRMHELLNAEESKNSCDSLWQQYQDLLELSEELSSQEQIRVLRCLRASKSFIDTERSLALFESIPINDRRAVHYSYAISAALKLKDTDTAVHIQREASGRLHSPVGTAAILHHAVMKDDWQLATRIWHAFWNTGLSYYTRDDIWAGIGSMNLRLLMSKAAAASEFAISEIESTGPRNALAIRDFALELIRRAFQAKGVAFDVDVWKLLHKNLKSLREHDAALNTTALDTLSIEQALNFGKPVSGAAALDQYCELRRRDTSVVLNKDLLEGLLERIDVRKSTQIMWNILEDWRTHYGKLDVRIYSKFMRDLARIGDANSVQALFNAYCGDYEKIQDARLCHNLLQVHYRRADSEQATKRFDELQNIHGILPDLTSYNIVMQTFARIGDTEGTLEWFERIEKAGMKPDASSYFALMLVYSKRGDRDTVLDLLEEATTEGIKPTKAMIDILVLANVNDNKLPEAEKLLEEALSLDFDGSRTHMWNVVLNAYALRQNLGKVAQLHRRMQEGGIPSDSMTYAALITSLSVAKHPRAALGVLTRVMPRFGLQPSALHFALVMGGFLKIKDYEKLFGVYKEMLKQNITPNMSTQNVLLRAAASVGNAVIDGESEEGAQFSRAREVLDQTIASLNRSELASLQPNTFVGPQGLEEAFTSTYFEYMIFFYGKEGAFQKVSELYRQYVTSSHRFSNRDVESSPPMKILSALLVAHIHAGNNEEIDRCWYLTLDKAETLARKASAKDLSEPDWVLPSRRFIINQPLKYYLDHLGKSSRVDDMIDVVNELLSDGYDLTHHNWNLYIQYLARSDTTSHLILAFTLAESILMPHWAGWEKMGPTKHIKYRFKGMAKEMLKDPAKRSPTYLTLVYLTAAYVELGFGREKGGRMGVDDQVLPIGKTLDAVRNLPLIDDWEQRNILKREPEDV